jgi:hypothetical protein
MVPPACGLQVLLLLAGSHAVAIGGSNLLLFRTPLLLLLHRGSLGMALPQQGTWAIARAAGWLLFDAKLWLLPC